MRAAEFGRAVSMARRRVAFDVGCFLPFPHHFVPPLHVSTHLLLLYLSTTLSRAHQHPLSRLSV